MAKTILVLSDQHEQDNCSLLKAHDIAAPLGENIEVVRFLTSQEQDESTIESMSLQLEIALQEIFADYNGQHQVSSQVIVTDNVAQWATDYCTDKSFDLIIKTGHRSESLFHTPCDWELLRNLNMPILIANSQRWNSKHSVMAAVDPTTDDPEHKKLNTNILNWTKKWCDTFHCKMHVVYSIPYSSFLKDLDIIDTRQFEKEHKPQAEAQLHALLAEHDMPDVHAQVTSGPPEKAIPHCANELKAELVIMGSMGRTGIKRLIKGNMAEKAMHHLRTDSLVV